MKINSKAKNIFFLQNIVKICVVAEISVLIGGDHCVG
jgi:hypothetical protein